MRRLSVLFLLVYCSQGFASDAAGEGLWNSRNTPALKLNFNNNLPEEPFKLNYQTEPRERGEKQPVFKSRLTPIYPPESRRLGEQGEVGLHITAREDGSIIFVELAKSSGFARLDEAALNAAYGLTKLPADAQKRGEKYYLPVVFKLHDDAAPVYYRSSNPAPISAEHLQATKELLTRFGVGELFIEGMRRGVLRYKDVEPDLTEDWLRLVKQVTPKEAIDRVAPIYAKSLTPALVSELLKIMSSPVASSAWKKTMWQILYGPPGVKAVLTPEEQRMTAVIERNASFNAFLSRFPEINQSLKLVSSEWGDALLKKYFGSALLSLDDSQVVDVDAPYTISAQGTVPAYMELFNTFKLRTGKLARDFMQKVTPLQVGKSLSPSALTSRASLAEGRQNLDAYEAELAIYIKALNKQIDGLMLGMRSLPGSGKLRGDLIQDAEQGVEGLYNLYLRYDENQRRLLGQVRRLITLADERFNVIHLENNDLLFESTEDLRIYQAIRQELGAEVKIEAELKSELLAARERFGQRLQKAADNVALVADSTAPRLAWIKELHNRVKANLIQPPNTAPDLRVVITAVLLPNGKVLDVKVKRSSGFEPYDRAAQSAILKTSPLPLPAKAEAFAREIDFSFVSQ